MKFLNGPFTGAKGAGSGVIFALALCASTAAEAPDIVLETGGAENPITGFRDLQPVSGPNLWLKFELGIATFEEILSGSFLDSATLTLEGNSPGQTTIVATMDRSGIFWAPPTPGGLTLAPGAVQWTAIEFPAELNPELPYRKAYSAIVEIPEALRNQNLRFTFDLFDNKNGLGSAAYVSAPTVVPEPGALGLVVVGAFFLIGLKGRK